MAEKRTVLFVDDDEIILRSIKRGFLDEPYTQLLAKSGQEALDILQEEEVHAIVTDMCMPGMDGVELLKIVREKYPHIVRIILSGYTDMSILQEEFSEEEIFKFIPKPWKLEEDFKKVIRHALEHYNLQNECETTSPCIT
jgi:DNA-binding NtrC family response regulator